MSGEHARRGRFGAARVPHDERIPAHARRAGWATSPPQRPLRQPASEEVRKLARASQVREAVRKHIVNTQFVDSSSFSDEDDLLGIVDSLGMMELVAMVESEFGVRVDNRALTPANMGSVARIAAFVEPRMPKPSPRSAADSAPICCSRTQEES